MLPLRSTASAAPLQNSAGSQKLSSSPCYTCRRRRVICDRLLPTCRKCDSAQKACLGYKKPLTWVQGVASRGKMMGLTFDDVTTKKYSSVSTVHSIVRPKGFRHTDTFSFERVDPDEEASRRLLAKQGSFGLWHSARNSDSSGECQQADMVLSDRTPSDRGSEDEIECPLHIPSTLVDPLFQGLDKISRYYLTYYDRKFCGLMVLFEVPHNNPYRRLLQMVNDSSGVCAAMAAIGACHHLHVLHYSGESPFDSFSLKNKEGSFEDGEQFACSPNPNVRLAHQHLLLLKHRALCQLEQSLSNPRTRGDDASIASALLLMVLDMVESGRGAWKLHVEGAKRLLQSRFRPLVKKDADGLSPLSCAAHDSFNMFLAGSCMTFDIMGSTLTPSGHWSEPVSSQLITSPNLLSATEKKVWLGCPGSLLHIILFISSLRHSDSSSKTTLAPKADISVILSQINAFDPEHWTREMHHSMYTGTDYPASDHPLLREPHWNPPVLGSFDSAESNSPFSDALYHLASAYKITITLYATRILLHPPPDECAFFADEVTEVLTHISLIPPTSELFKSILWPTFIAGAECRCPEQRTWIRDRLDLMWRGCWTVNIREAMRVLDAIWSREEQHDGDWADYFDRSGVNWLFI
ncbi:hypothetical protein AJ78_02462 [Emergomyces pasteurianus Ep9510]|uniref:Zn(2)-C6 fungal-type domain-containing protein n=1 Tax=Emergomyces pasteurianus Ep9510 TaxID=1447872 RepID=A0A1J9QQA6_9EURO|nr:hypothetical protein AJ78_02462 [Emergomyces pasteurianus Ep9510]